jgi:hypothetical protein
MTKLRITSTNNFIGFLKKLKSVDKSVLLEITSDRIFSKIHTPDKAVMKYASLNFSEVLEGEINWKTILKGKSSDERIKVGILEVSKLIDCFKHFRPEEEVFIDINTDILDDSCVATEINLVSKSLKIKIKCADQSLLSYVNDDILGMVHSKQDYSCKFKIYQSDFSTLISLCGLENNSEEVLTIEVDSSEVRAMGDSFNYKLNISSGEIECSEKSTFSIYKNQLSYMEAESCDCFIHPNRIVMFSEQTDTSIAYGVVVK